MEVEEPNWLTKRGTLKIVFADVGQGACTVIITPKNKMFVVDCGSISSGETESGEKAPSMLARNLNERLKDWMSQLGIKGIECLIISHPDQDHYNLVPEVFKDIKIIKYCIGDKLSKYSANARKGSERFDDFMGKTGADEICLGGDHYCDSPIDRDTAKLHGGIPASDDAEIRIVTANATKAKAVMSILDGVVTRGTASNSNSIVLAIRYGKEKRQILLTADATHLTEAEMLNGKWKNNLKSDGMTGCHHGSDASWDPKFLKECRPAWVYFSADFKYMHPRAEKLRAVLGYLQEEKPLYGSHGIVMGRNQKQHQSHMRTIVSEPDEEAFGCPFMRNVKDAIFSTVGDYLKEQKVKGTEFGYTFHGPRRGKKDIDITDEVRAEVKEQVKSILKNWAKRKVDKKNAVIEEFWVDCAKRIDCAKSDDEHLDRIALGAFEMIAEELMLGKYVYKPNEQSWWWYTTSHNIFTSMETANLGVFWVVTINSDGEREITRL